MIHRAEHSDGYTVINNAILRDVRLSDGARCLLVFMLSMSDDWNFSEFALAKALGISKGTVKARVAELKKLGYIKTTMNTGERGRFTSCTWEIWEEPDASDISPRDNLTAHGRDRTRSAPHTVVTAHGKTDPLGNTNIKEIPNLKEVTSYKKTRAFIKPTVEEVAQYCQERNNGVDPQHFIDHYEANGWRVGKNPMKDWRATVRTWERYNYDKPRALPTAPKPSTGNEFLDLL